MSQRINACMVRELADGEMRVVADAPIPLAICQAVDLTTGEETEFATTAGVLTMFIRRAELIGAIPFDAKIVGKKTANGQTALNFERV